MGQWIGCWLTAFLLNAIWQVPVVWLAACALARLLRREDAGLEHGVWVGALLLEVVIPMSATWHADAATRWLVARFGGRLGRGPQVRVEMLLGHVSPAAPTHPRWLRPMLFAYGVALLLAAARLLRRYLLTRRLVRGAVPVPMEEWALEPWRHACDAFRMREVRVLQSAEVEGPMTCGIRRRWLLLPPGLLDEVSGAEWRAILAHELAHMRRHDFAKNLLYEVLQLPVAWHPAVWATHARLVESREWVCDATAVRTLAQGGAQDYGRSLLRLASLRLAAKPARQVHAIGIFDANTLEERVMRLTGKRSAMGRGRRSMTVVAGGLLALGVCAPAWAWGVHAGEIQGQTSPAGAPQPLQVRGDVMAGQLRTQVNPVYPPGAKAAGTEGKVVLAAEIGTDGSLSALRLVSGPPELAKAAWTAVSQWTWKPYLLNGEPTPVQTTITVNFHLQP